MGTGQQVDGIARDHTQTLAYARGRLPAHKVAVTEHEQLERRLPRRGGVNNLHIARPDATTAHGGLNQPQQRRAQGVCLGKFRGRHLELLLGQPPSDQPRRHALWSRQHLAAPGAVGRDEIQRDSPTLEPKSSRAHALV